MNQTRRQRCFFRKPPLASARLTIRGIGINDHLPPWSINRPRGTGDYLLMCAGDPTEIDPQGTLLDRGAMILWPPKARQFYRNRRGLRHSWLHVNGQQVEALVQKLGIPLIRPFAPGSQCCCDQYLDALYQECCDPAPDEAIALALMEAFLRSLMRRERRDVRAPVELPEPFATLRREIEGCLDRRLALPYLAAQAGCSVQHLVRRFRALVGETPIAYQARLRMQHAAQLLHDPERPIADIAVAVGCSDGAHFSKAFRRHHGCSPRTWRHQAVTDR